MMNKKWWLLTALLLVLAIGVAIGILVFIPPTPGVTYANYSRIEEGMSRDEVNALLGAPRRQGVAGGVFRGDSDGKPGLASSRWDSGDNAVVVEFDEDGRVVAAAWNFVVDERSSWEKLRDRLPFVAKEPPQVLHIF